MPAFRIRHAFVLVFIACALLWPAAGDTVTAFVTPDREGCPHSSDLPDRGGRLEASSAVLCLLNQHRASHGLPALVKDPHLQAAAQAHAEDMGRRNYHAHRDPDGVEPDQRIRRAGFEGRTTGENIAWGVGIDAAAARIVDAWMDSPGHRANILRPSFDRVGTGIGYDAPERVQGGLSPGVYVNNFGG